jgi:nitroreductase
MIAKQGAGKLITSDKATTKHINASIDSILKNPTYTKCAQSLAEEITQFDAIKNFKDFVDCWEQERSNADYKPGKVIMTESPEAISRKDLIEILRVGLQAVSPYNAQPWGFQFKDNQLLIYTRHNDRGFWKCKDAIFHSLGAFLENLSEGARHYHYEISFTHETDKYMNLTKPLCFVNFKNPPILATIPLTTSCLGIPTAKHIAPKQFHRRSLRTCAQF